MPGKDTLQALIKIVRGVGWTPEQVGQFKERWSELRPNDAPICPGCFDESGAAMPLQARPASDGYKPLVCESCGADYQVPEQ
jgi:hypothetical protein